MSALRILVVDDEPLARERLIGLVNELSESTVVGAAANGIEALERVDELEPDVVLLDIRMPAMDGLEAARHLAKRESPPAVIFTTAYDDHALAAFEASAMDYLLKPIKRERLEQGLERARTLAYSRLAQVVEHPAARRRRTHLSAVRQGHLVLVPVAEVRYLLAEHKYVTATSPERELVLDESLRSLEEEFSSIFMRVHRSALVAIAHVISLERASDGSYRIRLGGVDAALTVSRRHLASVRERIAQRGTWPGH
jgi:two-component system response regulator AlgR